MTSEHDKKSPLVSSIEFQITALDALAGTAPIPSVQTPGIHPDNPKDLWSANLNLEARAECPGVRRSAAVKRCFCTP
ncbi:hypothetical protein GCM10010360_40180 [Streptomyces nogalater]